jgi:hypothetical protein
MRICDVDVSGICRVEAENMKNTVAKKLQRVQAIEEEYGESLREIITGFREQGCSWQTVEKVLEISHSALFAWRQELGIVNDGRMNYESRGSKSERAAIGRGYRSFRDWVRELRQKNMTLRQIAKKTGFSESFISESLPEELKYQWIVTDKMIQAREKNLALARIGWHKWKETKKGRL